MRFRDPFAPVARAGNGGRAERPAGPASTPQPSTGEVRNPERMTKSELQGWADDLGLSISGTKPELVKRIRAAI